MTLLHWKIGVEIELLAPPGKSRRDLAELLAKHHNGKVRRFFHPQAELGKTPGTPIFENLTLGFEVVDAAGKLVALCVDDLTLQNNLRKQFLSLPGWYRIVSDDTRLLKLVMQQSNAAAPIEQVLEPIATLFGTQATSNSEGMIRVADDHGAPIAIASPLPGERERPCELVTPPIDTDHLKRLNSLLAPAAKLGFTAPLEGATHIHFDATQLCHPFVLANLVRILSVHGPALKQLVHTNPQCRRLGNWPEELEKIVQSPEFLNETSWEQARTQLLPLKLSKYCDFNIRNFIYAVPNKKTFEVRIFPVWLDAQTVIEAAGLFESILNFAVNSGNKLKPVPSTLEQLLEVLPLETSLQKCWKTKLIFQ